MRRIKFRFWNTRTEVFEQASYMFSSNGQEFPEYIIPLQFTGLKDKNGVEIYEGDILRWDDEQDEFDEDDVVSWYGGGFHPFTWQRPRVSAEVEVIGNIYENPELLEAQ